MRLISKRKNTYKQMIVAAATAVFLLGASTPDARAADSGAKAQGSKWYMSFNVPVMFIDDSVSISAGEAAIAPSPIPVPYTSTATNSYDTGFRISGAVGRRFDSGLRVEGEVFYGKSEVDNLTYTGISSPFLPGLVVPPRDIPVSGPASQFGTTVNLWYDFRTASRWKPYVGGGLGFIRVDQGDLEYDPRGPALAIAEAVAVATVLENLPPGTPPQAIEQARQQAILGAQAAVPPGSIPDVRGADSGVVYQFGLGIGYQYSDAITFQLGYRYLLTSEFEFTATSADRSASVRATTDLKIHLFELGIRYRF